LLIDARGLPRVVILPAKIIKDSIQPKLFMKNHRGGLPYGWRREASKEFFYH